MGCADRFFRYYEIGGVPFSVDTPVEFEEKEPYSLFATEKKDCDVKYVFSFIDSLPEPCGKLLFEEMNYRAYADGDRITRYIGFYKDGTVLDPPFATVTYSTKNSDAYEVRLPLDRDVPLKSAVVYRTLCFEHMLLSKKGLILHSSLVSTKYGAILFTAPSGTGKSTQGELWRKYRNAEVINGDCSLIRKYNGKYTAFGLPYSGTSGICINKRVPIAAVVYLGQAKQNTLKKLTGAAAFKAVFEGTKINLWDKNDTLEASNLIMSFLSEIPVFRLDCLPDESAVETLENELKKLC